MQHAYVSSKVLLECAKIKGHKMKFLFLLFFNPSTTESERYTHTHIKNRLIAIVKCKYLYFSQHPEIHPLNIYFTHQMKADFTHGRGMCVTSVWIGERQ